MKDSPLKANYLLTVILLQEDSIIIFCRSGRRADVARTKLQSLGYEKVYNAGGLEDLNECLNEIDGFKNLN